jgi:hypothetical protein
MLVDCPLKAKLKESAQDGSPAGGTGKGGASSAKPTTTSKKLTRKDVGFGGHVGAISYHVTADLTPFDPQLFLDDNGSNTDIVNDEDLLVEVQPLDAYVSGVGSAKITGIGVFVGKSINRDGTEVPIARKRVLVCPSFNRNIIGTSVLQRRNDVVFNRQCENPHMLAIMGDGEDDIYQYDLHDNPEDASDPFLYFQLVPLEEDEMGEGHVDFIAEAVEANRLEIRALQAQAYQTELKAARKAAAAKDRKSLPKTGSKKSLQWAEPLTSSVETAEIDKIMKSVSHAHEKKPSPPPIRRVSKEDRSEASPLTKVPVATDLATDPVEDMAVKASINPETLLGELEGVAGDH